MFHIHKIKPVHGWREFFGEVGIIVLGILIALGLEQVVEAVHWHRKVTETTQTLRDAVEYHVFAAVEQRIVAPCVKQQLDGLEEKLFAPGVYRPAKLYAESSDTSYVVRTPSRLWNDSVWSAVVAEGVSTHYDSEFRSRIDDLYTILSQVREIARQIDQLNARLNTLSLPITKDQSFVLQSARDIEEFKSKEEFLTLASRQILRAAGRANMMPPANQLRMELSEQSGTIAFCHAHHLRMNRLHPVDIGIPKTR